MWCLFPIFTILLLAGEIRRLDGHRCRTFINFVMTLWYINTVLLVFNMLPIYPLDGGQILRSLLWFVFGRARSLMIATIIGFVGVAGLSFCRIAVPLGSKSSIWHRHPGRVHPAELLGRSDAGARPGERGQCAAPRRFCLSGLQNRAAAGRVLALRQMPEAVRHL